MTRTEIAERIARIREAVDQGDYEAVHAAEDDLYRDVLRDIADGVGVDASLARAALEVADDDFARHCA